MKKKTLQQHAEETRQFEREVRSAIKDGFTPILSDGVVPDFGTIIDIADRNEASDPVYLRASSESCMCGDTASRGILMRNDPTLLDWSQMQYGTTPPDCGNPNLRFAKWGPFNAWPVMLYNASAALPFTASALDYLDRTLFGLGPQIVYCIARYSGGTVTHEEVPFRDADIYLKENIIRLLNKLEQLTLEESSESDQQDGANSTSQAVPSSLPAALLPSIAPQSQKKASRSAAYRDRLIAKYEKELEQAENDLKSYWDTRSRIEVFLENNNLAHFYKRWIGDTTRLGICFPMICLNRSQAGKWEPEIIRVEMRDACVMRLEERNPDNQFKIENVYYSERWRAESNIELQSADIVSYPAIMPEHALEELRQRVRKHHRTPVAERPYWQCCPSYSPTPTKPYYPQLPWWSIFPSQVYQYAVTLIYDKATARKNSTLWGRILFINTAYLAQVFNQAGDEGKTKEGQQKIRKSIYQSVENFLKNRDNNGKLLVMDSYPSADEKQMIDSVRIVDVPSNDNAKDSAQAIAETASLVSYSHGVNMDLIGSRPWSTTSATGTAQRELHLLKNGQLSPDRVTFTDFFNSFVFAFNRYDPHFRMTVPYPLLTTLDNSKTGIKTVTDGSDA